MGATSVIPQLITALDQFRSECLPRLAREEAYTGWLAHFLMMEFGAPNVIIESHHDGLALASQWGGLLNQAGHKWLPRSDQTKSGMNFDIAVTRTANVDARTPQRRRPESSLNRIQDQRQQAALYLLQFSLIIEIKIVEDSLDLKRTDEDKLLRDIVRLGATTATIADCCIDQPIPEAAFVVVLRGESARPANSTGLLQHLRSRALDVLARPDAIVLPNLFLVAHSNLEHA